MMRGGAPKRRPNFGIKVKGIDKVAVCGWPSAAARFPGTRSPATSRSAEASPFHREDCRNVRALKKAPERFTEVSWEGDNESSYRVELQVDAWDRTRLLEDLSRTFAEAGLNILEARCTTKHPMVKNRFVLEGGGYRSAEAVHLAAAQRRLGLRRIPRHPRPARSSAQRPHPQSHSSVRSYDETNEGARDTQPSEDGRIRRRPGDRRRSLRRWAGLRSLPDNRRPGRRHLLCAPPTPLIKGRSSRSRSPATPTTQTAHQKGARQSGALP